MSTFRLACILIGTTLAIDVRGKRHYFEVPHGCGLVFTNKDGEQIKDLGQRHPFWRAAECWRWQGRRIVDGVCIWNDPPMMRLKHLGGKHWRECAPDEKADRLLPGDPRGTA